MVIENKRNFLKLYRDNIFIDQNLVTFHSPDIEFDESLKNISNENLECKIVGFVNLTGFIGKKYINNGTPWLLYPKLKVISIIKSWSLISKARKGRVY